MFQWSLKPFKFSKFSHCEKVILGVRYLLLRPDWFGCSERIRRSACIDQERSDWCEILFPLREFCLVHWEGCCNCGLTGAEIYDEITEWWAHKCYRMGFEQVHILASWNIRKNHIKLLVLFRSDPMREQIYGLCEALELILKYKIISSTQESPCSDNVCIKHWSLFLTLCLFQKREVHEYEIEKDSGLANQTLFNDFESNHDLNFEAGQQKPPTEVRNHLFFKKFTQFNFRMPLTPQQMQ